MFVPKAGGCEDGAGNGDANEEPKEGVWLAPNPPEEAELNTKGDAAAEGAAEETAGVAVAPKLKEGAAAGAALAEAPKIKGCAEAGAGFKDEGAAG